MGAHAALQGIPSNVSVRSLGPEPLVQVDVEGPHPIEPGDIYLLCSDGLSGQVSDSEIGTIARTLPPAEACRFLIDLANLRGGPDNITGLIVKVGAGPESNGVAAPSAPRPRRASPVPWWMGALFSGTLLAVVAVALQYNRQTALAV